jgi:glycosyltransferase involved in cell wall biosynthesis
MMIGSLVQIHYHNRPGGVSAVMEQYAGAFRAAAGDRGVCIVVCASDRAGRRIPGMEVANVNACGYRTFRSAASFRAAAGALLARIEKVALDPALPRPIYVVGHNLTLCKNAALSQAFALLALRQADRSDTIRFFSVVHDFAEEGRCDLMAQAHFLERRGVRILDALYPVSRNLRYVAVSARTLRVLRHAGLDACLVPNLVALPAPRPGARPAGRVHTIWKRTNREPVLFYPGRIIARKNPVEAIILAQFFLSANLVLGEDGTSVADRALCRRLRHVCSRYNVRASFGGLGKKRRGKTVSAETYSRMYQAADACISTSVLEGFGYALYEPWLHNKAVIGRIPSGLSPDEIPDASCLYERFLVPQEWVDVPGLRKRYYARMRLCFGTPLLRRGFAGFSKQFDAAFIRGAGIDFGCLDSATQCALLEAVCSSGALLSHWKQAFPCQTRVLANSWSGALRSSARIAAANRKRIEAQHGTAAFAASLARCFSHTGRAGRPDPSKIRDYFSRPDRFRLLATPQAAAARHYCAISA